MVLQRLGLPGASFVCLGNHPPGSECCQSRASKIRAAGRKCDPEVALKVNATLPKTLTPEEEQPLLHKLLLELGPTIA